MGRFIALHLYHVEPTEFQMGWLYNRVQMAVPKSIDTQNEVEFLTEYNRAGAPSLAGLPFLYTKLTFKQPSLNQEVYVMQTVANLNATINA